MEIDNLTPAELRVWRAFPKGEAVDFRTAGDEDVADGAEAPNVPCGPPCCGR